MHRPFLHQKCPYFFDLIKWFRKKPDLSTYLSEARHHNKKKPAEGRFFLLWCQASAFTAGQSAQIVPSDQNTSRYWSAPQAKNVPRTKKLPAIGVSRKQKTSPRPKNFPLLKSPLTIYWLYTKVKCHYVVDFGVLRKQKTSPDQKTSRY